MKGDHEDPFTHDNAGECRAYKFCRCRACGTVALCTPSFDYYGGPVDGDGRELECEMCMRLGLKERGIRTNLLPPMTGVA